MTRLTDDNIAVLFDGMVGVVEINVERVIEDGSGFLERHSVLRQISPRLLLIPLKFHERSIASAVFSFDRERCLTPGITRRPASLTKLEKQRIGGRVHAVVSWRGSQDTFLL